MKKLFSAILVFLLTFSLQTSYAEIMPYNMSYTVTMLGDETVTDLYVVDVSCQTPRLKYITSFNSIEFSTGIPDEKFIEIIQKFSNILCDGIEEPEPPTDHGTIFKQFHFCTSSGTKFSRRMLMVSETSVNFPDFRLLLLEILENGDNSFSYVRPEEPWITFEEALEKYEASERIFLLDIFGNDGDFWADFPEVSLGIVNTSEKIIEVFLPMSPSTFKLIPQGLPMHKSFIRQRVNPLAIMRLFESILCNGRTPVKSVENLSHGTDEYEILHIKDKEGTKEVRIYYADDGSLCFDAVLEALMEVINYYGGITPVKGDLHGTFEQVIGGLAQDIRVK